MKNNVSDEKEQLSVGFLIDEILKKYNLQEDPDKMYQKIKNGGQINKAIISYLAKDFSDGKITEKDVYASIQKNFNVPSETIQKILNDVKNTVIPYLKEVSKNQLDNSAVEEKRTPIINKKTIITTLTKKTKKTEGLKSTGPDKYRESIG